MSNYVFFCFCFLFFISEPGASVAEHTPLNPATRNQAFIVGTSSPSLHTNHAEGMPRQDASTQMPPSLGILTQESDCQLQSKYTVLNFDILINVR